MASISCRETQHYFDLFLNGHLFYKITLFFIDFMSFMNFKRKSRLKIFEKIANNPSLIIYVTR